MHMIKFDKEIKQKVLPALIVTIVTVIVIYLLINLGNIVQIINRLLSSFVYLFYGIIIAYILNQPMKLIERLIEKKLNKKTFIYRKKRGISIITTLILLSLIILIVSSIVIPNLLESLILLFNNISSFIKSIFNNIDQVFAYFKIDFKMEQIGSVKELINMPWQDIVSKLLTLLTTYANGIMTNATHFLSTFGIMFTGFIFSLYLLSNKETFIRQLRKVIGAVFGFSITKVIFEYGHRINTIFSSFIGGQLVEACILWVLYYFTMRLFGFPFPELIATIISIFSLVPFFGPITSMCIGATLILSTDIFKAIWFIVYFQILSQLEDNLIYPRVVGSSVGLPGIWVLLSILVFGDLFGIFGMIIAVPSAACIYTFSSEIINKILNKRKLKITETEIKQID